MASHTTRTSRWRIATLIGVLAALGIGLILVLVVGRSEACGCPIPDSDDEAIETAIAFVAAGSDPPASLLHTGAEAPDGQRAAELAPLDDPDTHWVVLAIERLGQDYGQSPAERIILGISPGGDWATLLVHTPTDYDRGTVDPEVDESGDLEFAVHRSGPFPVFGDVGASHPSAPGWTLIDPGSGEVALERLHNKGAWAYTEAEPLSGERYLLASAFQHYQTEEWVVRTLWWSPEDPADAE